MTALNSSIMGSLEAAQALPQNTNQPVRTFVRICVCGHKENDHGEVIGGSRAPWFHLAGARHSRHIKLLGCCGEPMPPKTKRQLSNQVWNDTEERLPHTLKADLLVPVAERIITCPCPKFRPVLEVSNPAARFNQWRPVNPPRSGLRDRNPARHALMRGITATVTWLRKNAAVKKMETAGESETAIGAKVAELVEERIRWLPDGQRCWADGCSRTDDVLPVYLDDDLSEMRCPEHRP